MATTKSNYKFQVELTFLYGKKSITINENRITNIVINREYLTKNMPTIYAIINVESELYTDIAYHMNDGYFLLKIFKYDCNNSTSAKTKYINLKFNYICDIDRNKTLNSDSLNKDDYHSMSLGLYLQSIVDNNKKKVINNVFKNTNTISIIHYYTKHMKMIIEKFDNNRNIPILIIPPLDSITHLLNYLNQIAAFYSTEYLYFMDFDYTYLISTKPNAISINDGTYDTINISIVDNDVPSNEQGMTVNKSKKYYSFSVGRNSVDISSNRITDNKLNVLSGVSTDGFTSTSKINSNKTSNSGSKNSYVRVHNDNLTYINQIKNTLESKSTIITIAKVGLDPSIFTPIKKYNIKNTASNKDLDGTYKLIGRKELYPHYTKSGVCTTILTFEKVS